MIIFCCLLFQSFQCIVSLIKFAYVKTINRHLCCAIAPNMFCFPVCCFWKRKPNPILVILLNKFWQLFSAVCFFNHFSVLCVSYHVTYMCIVIILCINSEHVLLSCMLFLIKPNPRLVIFRLYILLSVISIISMCLVLIYTCGILYNDIALSMFCFPVSCFWQSEPTHKLKKNWQLFLAKECS